MDLSRITMPHTTTKIIDATLVTKKEIEKHSKGSPAPRQNSKHHNHQSNTDKRETNQEETKIKLNHQNRTGSQSTQKTLVHQNS